MPLKERLLDPQLTQSWWRPWGVGFPMPWAEDHRLQPWHRHIWSPGSKCFQCLRGPLHSSLADPQPELTHLGSIITLIPSTHSWDFCWEIPGSHSCARYADNSHVLHWLLWSLCLWDLNLPSLSWSFCYGPVRLSWPKKGPKPCGHCWVGAETLRTLLGFPVRDSITQSSQIFWSPDPENSLDLIFEIDPDSMIFVPQLAKQAVVPPSCLELRIPEAFLA